jgi:O-antigen ligase
VLTVFLLPCFIIPSIYIIGPLGAGGTPANLVGMGLLAWWALEKVAGGDRIDRQRQPLRLGVLVFGLSLAASMVALHLRPDTGKEVLGAYRGLMLIGCLFGVLLVAADGIPSVERALVLVHRIVTGVSLMAVLGLFEFFTHFNPARVLLIPGLVRNTDAFFEPRSLFVRVQSTALHPIEFGALIGMMLPLAVHCAFHETGDRRARRLAWAKVAAIGGVLPMTLSRTGVIAAAIGVVALLSQWTWRRRLRALVVSLVFVAGLRVVTPGLVGSVTGLFTFFFQDTSTNARTSRYGIAGDYFGQHPVFGRGYNTLFPATQQIFDNSYLYFAIETGVVGLACLAFFFITVFGVSRGIRLRTEDPALRDLAGLFTAMAISMPLIFATADVMVFNLMMQLFFVMAGIAGALWRLTGGPQGTIIERSRRRAVGKADSRRDAPAAPAHAHAAASTASPRS